MATHSHICLLRDLRTGDAFSHDCTGRLDRRRPVDLEENAIFMPWKTESIPRKALILIRVTGT
jgi:hypothetical protein